MIKLICNAKVIITAIDAKGSTKRDGEIILSPKELDELAARIALETEMELNNLGVFRSSKLGKVGVRIHIETYKIKE